MATDVDVTPLLRQPLYERSENNELESPPLSPEVCTQPVPRALAGIIVYVDVRSIDSRENRSSAIASELEALGATVCAKFTKDVTHVVFKDGKPALKERAEKSKVYLVSPLWVEACKRANDWISEAKYPVITRDTSDPTSTPVVLGKIKRIKSMQPKPLEEEISKSLERNRKRPPPAVRGAAGEKRRRDALVPQPLLQEELEQDEDSCTSGIDLPSIDLPSTPGQPLHERSANTVTPFLTVNDIIVKKQTNKQKTTTNDEKENKTMSDASTDVEEEDDFREEMSSKVVSKGNKSRSKVISKVAKFTKAKALKKQSVRSKGDAMVTKKDIVAKQRGKADAHSKKMQTKKALVAKKGKKMKKAKNVVTIATEPLTELPSETTVDDKPEEKVNSLNKKKRRSNNDRLFSRELPGLVMTSVCRGDQELVMSVVKKLGGFTTSSMVDDITSHVVCGHARRTVNVLTATLRGCWIITLDWILKSLEAGKWLPEEPFEMSDSFPAAQLFRLERATAGLLFRPSFFREAGSIYVSPTSTPPTVQLELLLTAGGANVTRSLRKTDVCVGCHSPRESLEEGGTVCVTEAWILDSISVHRMLPYDRYILDRPHSTPTSPEL